MLALSLSLSPPPSPFPSLPISSLRVLVYTIGGVRGRALARIRARFRSANTPDYPRVDTPGTANIPRDSSVCVSRIPVRISWR